MPFDPSPISDVRLARDGDMLAVSWSSSAPVGSTYQAYVDRRLAWSGTMPTARLPWPAGPVWIDVGVVPAADASTNFGSTLTGGHAERVLLTWQGGSYLSATIASFAIYSSLVPGGSVSFASPVGSVPAYEEGLPTDGYGMGGYGRGGYGRAASSYSWTSPVLSPGVWTFAVAPIDLAGNRQSSPATATATIAGPPNPPAVDAIQGVRLSYTYNPSTRVATLNWHPSPS